MRNFLNACILFMLSVLTVNAQTVKIFGTVYNTDKKPVADWPVSILSSPATNAAGVRLTTNADGYYEHEFKVDRNISAYLVTVVDPCNPTPQIQKAPAVEGKHQLDFVICASTVVDPCEGNFKFDVLQDGWVVFHANTAANVVLEYFWEFGDGTSASGREVKHQYTSPGVYTVNLIIAGPNCKKLYTFRVEIKDSTPPPPPPTTYENACCGKVNITSATLNTSAGNAFTFRATAGFPIKEVSWDFGDRSTGTGEEVKHVYAQPGKYLVTTKIVGELCTVILNTWIHVGDVVKDTCDIDFGFSTDQLSAKFRADLKGKTADKLKWDFGDGTGSTDAETSHTYAKAGVYKVTLYVSIGGKICQITKEIKVGSRIDPNDPCNATILTASDQLTVKFELKLNVKPDKIFWDLGDGNTSTDLAVKHTYAKAGTYVVTVVYVVNGVECKVSKKIIVGSRTGNRFDISIYDVNPNPAADQITVSIRSSEKATVTLVIADVTGTGLLKKQVDLEPGDNKVPMELVNLKPGAYIVYLYFENKIISKALFQKI